MNFLRFFASFWIIMTTAEKVCIVQFCLLLYYYEDRGLKMSFVVVIELSCFLVYAYEERGEGVDSELLFVCWVEFCYSSLSMLIRTEGKVWIAHFNILNNGQIIMFRLHKWVACPLLPRSALMWTTQPSYQTWPGEEGIQCGEEGGLEEEQE